MERLIGGFLTIHKHTNMFYKHKLTQHSFITAFHQLHRAVLFLLILLILRRADRKKLPGNLFTQDFGYFQTLGQSGGQTLGVCGRICEEKRVLLEKQRKANLLSLDKWVWKIVSAKRATFVKQNKEQEPKSRR